MSSWVSSRSKIRPPCAWASTDDGSNAAARANTETSRTLVIAVEHITAPGPFAGPYLLELSPLFGHTLVVTQLHGALEPSPPVAAAPWTLRGDGFMLFYRFSEEFVNDSGFVQPELRGQFRGGVGVVILVDYRDSNVGPYQELLFAPGRFKHADGRSYMTVSKIYVSSEASVANGRRNWGIPKEQAAFSIDRPDDNVTRYRVSTGKRRFAELQLRTSRLAMPAHSSLLPRSLTTYVQPYEGKHFKFRFSLKGSMRFAKPIATEIDSDCFPPLQHGKFLIAARFTNFVMTMPTPTYL